MGSCESICRLCGILWTGPTIVSALTSPAQRSASLSLEGRYGPLFTSARELAHTESALQWPDAGLTLPGYPVRKTAGSCFIFAELVQSVSEHFLSWWTCEVRRWSESCCSSTLTAQQLRNNSSGGSPSESPYAPGTVQLDQVFLVALRPRHIALGVYEWFPGIELRL